MIQISFVNPMDFGSSLFGFQFFFLRGKEMSLRVQQKEMTPNFFYGIVISDSSAIDWYQTQVAATLLLFEIFIFSFIE